MNLIMKIFYLRKLKNKFINKDYFTKYIIRLIYLTMYL